MKILTSALIPIEQAIVVFYGNEVVAVHLPDEHLAPTLNSLCAMLGVRPDAQARRIRRDENLARHLLRTLVETSGGLQIMDVLIAEYVPDWVMGLQLKRIAPEKRPLILAIKAEIVDALHRRFFGGQATQPKPESQAAPPPQPAPSKTSVAPDSLWDQLFDVLHAMQQKDQAKDEQLARYQRAQAERFAVIEEWITSLDRRVAGAGQGTTDGLGWMPLLSAAHLADVRALLRSLERTTERTQAQLEQEMIETFGVSAINAIPDEQWEDVLAWCLWRTRQPD